MSGEAQTVLLVVAIVLGGLLAVVVIRQILRIPGRIRRSYRPERRVIRVIGVGGGGSNAVDRMIAARIPGVSYVAINTDAQALRRARAASRIRIGDSITRGLGAGGNPEIGRRSAEENEAKIVRAVAGADLVFITTGLGGGTGSGAAPVVGADARMQGALTIALVTEPFAFEGVRRRRIADAALADLAANVDAVIAIPNDRVADVVADDTPMLDAFRVVDDVLLEVARGIIDLIRGTGLINLDFSDVQSIVQGAGPTIIGLGRGSGENRALDAARRAVASPLLEASIDGAREILFNVSGPADLQLREVRAAADEIRASADPDAYIIFGASLGRRDGDEVLITLIATGLAWPAGSEVATRMAAMQESGSRSADGNGRSARAVGPGVPADGIGPPHPSAAATPGPGHPAEHDQVAVAPTLGRGQGTAAPAAPAAPEIDLETPSFLRRNPSS